MGRFPTYTMCDMLFPVAQQVNNQRFPKSQRAKNPKNDDAALFLDPSLILDHPGLIEFWWGFQGLFRASMATKRPRFKADEGSTEPPVEVPQEKTTLFTSYARLLKRYPLLVGPPQQGVIVASANITKQYLYYMRSTESSSQFAIQWPPVRNAALLGCVFMCPLLHLWYLVLNKFVKSSFLKTAIDQGIMAWFFNTYAQYVLSVLNNKPFQFSSEHVHLVLISWLWWVPVKSIMFTFVPEHFWLPYSAFGGYCWNLIMFLFMNK